MQGSGAPPGSELMRVHRQPSGTREFRPPTSGLAVLLLALLPWFEDLARARERFTRLKSDEQIVFFPTLCQRVAGKAEWRVEIRGCVFEPEKRAFLVAALGESLELKHVKLTVAEQAVFEERARLFLVDHERGRRIFVRIGETVSAVGKSKADGTFAGAIVLPDGDFTRLRATDENGNWRVRCAAELPPLDTRGFAGETIVANDAGVSVISDIDDTIKVTQVTDHQATLRNTFLRPFEPVPEMAAFYRRLARSNHAVFHYISASPWQLYAPLSEFIRSNGFPTGDFALKDFHWKDRTFLSLFADPEKYKRGIIEPLLKRFPKRRFICIGDSGERDPEIYAALARQPARQIARIYIRDVTGEAEGAERYAKTFRGLPRELWQVFNSPDELKPFVDNPPALP
jgi:hypothetical protein